LILLEPKVFPIKILRWLIEIILGIAIFQLLRHIKLEYSGAQSWDENKQIKQNKKNTKTNKNYKKKQRVYPMWNSIKALYFYNK
jgi:hypothetical protein